jgi:hypothetical protein
LPLRVQLRLTTDVSQGFQRSLTVAETEAVVEAVQVWLSELLAGSPAVDDNPDGLSSS